MTMVAVVSGPIFFSWSAFLLFVLSTGSTRLRGAYGRLVSLAHSSSRCCVELDDAPDFDLKPHVATDPFYRSLETIWMAQQLPWAVLFFAIGGWSLVVWGIGVRVTVLLNGHWLIAHFAHRMGH